MSREIGLENEPDLVKDAVPPTKPALRVSALHCGERFVGLPLSY